VTQITRRAAVTGLASLVSTQTLADGSNLIRYEQMASAFIEPRNISVWLPRGYQRGNRQYPVIYMHDGQNAFSPAFAFRGQPWEIDEALNQRGGADDAGSAIVVGIWNTPKRRSDYAPNAIEAFMPARLRARIVSENQQPSAGDAYLRFIVSELKPLIDATYRTKKGPRDTTIMGASRGGMISIYGLCEYPQIFGAAACLSTHWLMLSAPSQTTDPNLETPAVAAAIEAYLRAKLPKSGTHKIWMDHGTINLDSFYGPYQDRVDTVFTSQGWVKGRDFESRVYEGADHNEAAWRARLGPVLDFVLGT
jgi:predicted alpha/beta superfamily hydrolase